MYDAESPWPKQFVSAAAYGKVGQSELIATVVIFCWWIKQESEYIRIFKVDSIESIAWCSARWRPWRCCGAQGAPSEIQQGHVGAMGVDSKRGGVALPTKVFAKCLLLDYPAAKCWKLNAIQEPTSATRSLAPRNFACSALRLTETCLRCRCNDQLRMLQQVGFREKGLGGGNCRRSSNL